MGLTAASYHSRRLLRRMAVVAAVSSMLGACGGKTAGLTPPPAAPVRQVERGVASWYGRPYHGRPTSSGEIYDMDQLTAAHPSLPFGSEVRIVNLANGRSVLVRINDRGPFVKRRVIDLSREAARQIDMLGPGTAEVRLEVVRLTAESRCPSAPFFAIQAGAFGDRENAERMRGKMALERSDARILASPDGRLFRVVLGSFAARSEAQQALAEARRIVPEAFVARIETAAASGCGGLS